MSMFVTFAFLSMAFLIIQFEDDNLNKDKSCKSASVSVNKMNITPAVSIDEKLSQKTT